MKHLGLFAAGVLFGTAGLKILSSKDAKKVYSHTTAAVLRAKDCVMQAVTNVREDAEDVYADAKDINEARAQQEAEAVIEELRPIQERFRQFIGDKAYLEQCYKDNAPKAQRIARKTLQKVMKKVGYLPL